MPVFELPENQIGFPYPDLAEPDGLLAVGGGLSVPRLINAYSLGIFPWYSEESPVLWWTPDPRCVLFIKDFHVPRSLGKFLRKAPFTYSFDTAFEDVIRACADLRKDDGTWLLPEMQQAYCALHRQGLAHSVEVWQGQSLVGGLYGVSIGRMFFGESMFFTVPNASKAALVFLVQKLAVHGFAVIDCQQATDNLLRFGATLLSRQVFMQHLKEARRFPTLQGSWENGLDAVPTSAVGGVLR